MIFHMAANVRFDQALKPAVLMNTGGTKNVLDLACHFKQLLSFVHVSTSYCHCDETELKEQTYPVADNPMYDHQIVNKLCCIQLCFTGKFWTWCSGCDLKL